MAELRGVARDDTYVAKISIDGAPYPVKVSAAEIEFSRPVRLEPGTNAFEVTVEDLLGNRTIQEVVVQSDVDGPTVSFDDPVVLPGRVQGVAMDRSGVAAMHIAGRSAKLTEAGPDLVQFAVDLPRDAMRPPLEFECEDGFGNTTRGALPVAAMALARGRDDLSFAAYAPARAIPLGRRWKALVLGGEVVALAQAPSDEPGQPGPPAALFLPPSLEIPILPGDLGCK